MPGRCETDSDLTFIRCGMPLAQRGYTLVGFVAHILTSTEIMPKTQFLVAARLGFPTP